MNKKDLLDNIRDYTPREIAKAIKDGVVTFYELRSGTHGQFTPMVQRQVKQKLEEGDVTEPEKQQTGESSSATDTSQEQNSGPISEPIKETGTTPLYQELDPQPLRFDTSDPVQTPPGSSPKSTQNQSQDVQRQSVTKPQDNTTEGVNANLGTPKCLKKFSWGGFLFGWLWGIFNGVAWSMVTLLLGILAIVFLAYFNNPILAYGIPLLLWIAIFVIHIYLGAKGNRMAWKSKKYASAEAFDTIQVKWEIAGFILYGFIFGMIILLFILAVSY